MNPSLPTAVVGGIENFAAQKLIRVLLASEMNVVGVGEVWPILEENNNFSLTAECSEVPEGVSYVFDFGTGEPIWEVAEKNGAKLTVVIVNKERDGERIRAKLSGVKVNSRIVKLNGVYGPGMGEEELMDETAKILAKALREAVENKNLTLPHPMTKLRLLAVDDAVEAAMRASFLSGTEGETIEVYGDEVEVRDVASVLMDEAKMTRFKVSQKDLDYEKVDEEIVANNRSKIRWSPKVDFKDGIKEVLQDFFVRIDEEKRKGIKRTVVKAKESRRETRNYELVVEENPVEVERVRVVEPEPEVIESEEKPKAVWRKIKAEEVEEKPRESVIKNSNLRWLSKNEAEENEVVNIKEEPRRVVRELSFEKDNKEVEVQPTEKKEERRGIRPLPIKKEETVEAKSQPVLTKENRKKGMEGKWWMIGGGVIMVGLLTGMGVWLGSGLLVVKEVTRFGDLIKKKDYVAAAAMSKAGADKVQKMDEEINDWGLNRIAIFRNYQSGMRVLGEVLRLENRSVEAIKLGENLADGILKDNDVDWKKDWKKGAELMDELIIDMGNIQGRLGGNWSWLPDKWRGYPNKGVKTISEVKEVLVKVRQGWEITPDLLGTDGKRREYLVLFQNENELRAGGGFIGSYGILSFEDGKLLNLEVKDIYEADGQLKGHVEPPEPIKTYLGEAAWFMRDANWQADFKGSAKDIQWFLEKETGRQVDGVIGVNLAVAKEILGAVGEVYVPDFKEKVNKDNLYEQAEFYSETKFFPGSNQKASFLGGLSRQLFEEIKDLNTEKKGKLLEAMVDLLEKNEIQLAVTNPATQGKLAEYGWDGGMYQGKCAEARCFTDYLYVVESNLGVNKANYFVHRGMEQSVDISQGAIGRVLKITYENTSKNNNWPGGDYKNYMRIYIPKSSNVAEVSIAEGEGKGKKIYSGSELRVSEVNGKKELGFWMVVPAGQSRLVEVRYSDQIDIGKEKQFSYLHYMQRQSGYGDTGLVTLISFPTGWQPLQVEPAASLMGGKLLFNQKFDRDIRMGVEIGK